MKLLMFSKNINILLVFKMLDFYFSVPDIVLCLPVLFVDPSIT